MIIMTGAELTERCKSRNFDCITVVTRDIFGRMANMQKVQKDIPGMISICTQECAPLTDRCGACIEYSQKQAVYYYANTSMCFVEPLEGDTVYKQFLDRYGEGLCCIRERILPDEMERLEKHFADKGYMPVQRMEMDGLKAFWIDLTKELGIIFEVISKEADEQPAVSSDVRIAQINISTPNVQKTIEFITEMLEIGPWEVGKQCNAVAHDTAFTVDGVLKDQQFAFLLAILVCGNIEWEVIEPVEGQLIYSDFIEKRGIGFHHILQEIPSDKWTGRLETYAQDGIALNCKGGLGPVSWCYMDTEKELGFYIELRNDAVMDKLPEGYLQYFYPAD